MYFLQTGIQLEFTIHNAKLLYILPNDVPKAEPVTCTYKFTHKKEIIYRSISLTSTNSCCPKCVFIRRKKKVFYNMDTELRFLCGMSHE